MSDLVRLEYDKNFPDAELRHWLETTRPFDTLTTSLDVLAMDFETTMKGPDHAVASPFFGGNRLLTQAFARKDGTHCWDSSMISEIPFINLATAEKPLLICGHNIKFDLMYVWSRVFSITKLVVWDTQVVDYLLSGQRNKFTSLEELAQRYSMPFVKDPDVVAAFESKTPELLPLEKLQTYNCYDAVVTLAVATKQMEEATASGKLPLILAQMSALLAITECEFNGLQTDLEWFNKMQTWAEEALHDNKLELYGLLSTLKGLHGVSFDTWADIPNLDSPDVIAAILYGGELEESYIERKVLKNGKVKDVKRSRTHPCLGLGLSPTKLTPGGKPSVDSEVLANLSSVRGPSGDFAKLLLERREIEKLHNTYIRKLPTYVDMNGIIHHTIHQTATDTGRTSSSKPNLQNVPITDNPSLNVQKGFVSQFGSDGVILCADYKQIEVIGLAWDCQDPQLIDDLKNGRDIHQETGAMVYGHSMTKEQKRVVKGINFGLIYGGGVKTLAAQSGQPEVVVRSIIKAFYERYPKVKERNNELYEELNLKIPHSTMFVDPVRSNRKIVTWDSPTGRTYSFTESENGRMDYATMCTVPALSYTQVCNYRVQGFATGDFVPTVAGRVWRLLRAKDAEWYQHVKMINMVHDSLMFDVHKKALADFVPWLRTIMEDGADYMNTVYDLEPKFDLPVRVEITHGPSWGEQKETEY